MSETQTGTVRWPNVAGFYDTVSAWRYLKGGPLDDDHPWNLLALYQRVEAGLMDGNLLVKGEVPQPTAQSQEFWAFDIQRDRLPVISPSNLELILPADPDRRRQVQYELRVVEWLYPDLNAACAYRTIRHFDTPLHNIIMELSKAVLLRALLEPSLYSYLESLEVEKKEFSAEPQYDC